MSRGIGLNNAAVDADIEGEVDFGFFDNLDGDKPSEDILGSGEKGNQSSTHFQEIQPNSTKFSLMNKGDTGNDKIVSESICDNKCSDKTKTEEVNSEKNPLVRPCNGNSTVLDSVEQETAECRTTLLHKYLDACHISTEGRDTNNANAEEKTSDDEGSENSLDVSVSEYDSEDVESDNGHSSENGSDSEITDVSPLPSNYNSPMPSSPRIVRRGVKLEENNSNNRTSIPGNQPVDIEQLMQAIVEITDEHRRSKSQATLVGRLAARHRKNMSFTNEEVRRIDRENQRLLKQLLLEKQKTRKPSAEGIRMNKPSSTCINRTTEQKRIEAENLSLLKRIQTAKPARDLSRSHLMNNGHHYSSISSAATSRPSSSNSKLHHPSMPSTTAHKSFKHSSTSAGQKARFEIPSNLNATVQNAELPPVQRTSGSHSSTTKPTRTVGNHKNGMSKIHHKTFIP